MEVMKEFIRGALNSLRIMGASMLYRHPCRISAEGLRSDWVSIGKDIESVFGKLKEDRDE